MKRYILFTASYWESEGFHRTSFGWSDFAGDFDTIREAEIKVRLDLKPEQFQIVDTVTKKVVMEESNPPEE